MSKVLFSSWCMYPGHHFNSIVLSLQSNCVCRALVNACEDSVLISMCMQLFPVVEMASFVKPRSSDLISHLWIRCTISIISFSISAQIGCMMRCSTHAKEIWWVSCMDNSFWHWDRPCVCTQNSPMYHQTYISIAWFWAYPVQFLSWLHAQGFIRCVQQISIQSNTHTSLKHWRIFHFCNQRGSSYLLAEDLCIFLPSYLSPFFFKLYKQYIVGCTQWVFKCPQ